jgi:isopenicillin N synthase-like dioxygenase
MTVQEEKIIVQDEAFATSFTAVPILPLSQARDPNTKPAFLRDLRDTLLNVGFLYISETGLPEDLVRKVCELTKEFFNEDLLPLEEKESIEMKNEKSFLGWSRVGRFSFFSGCSGPRLVL